ncbi:MAG: type II secretion system F family protein [candidate division Zixibacteria bacterium]
MKQVWTYKARDHAGNLITGETDAERRDIVIQSLSEQGLIPTSIRPRSEGISFSDILGNFGSTNRESLIVFTKKLLTLYRAGIPLLRALSIIEKGALELGLSKEIAEIKNDLQSGQTLSKAMSRHPKKFPSIYIASVSAGETSGTLDEVLKQLGHLIEKEMILARQIKSALRYPIMVIIAITIAIFVLMSFVIPKFSSIYGKFGAELPLATKIVISVSNVFSSYWYLILALIIIGIFGLKRFISTTRGRLIWDELILKIPIIGDLTIKFNVARFATMLKSLFKSGVPMVSCLNILQETTSNKVIASEISQIAESFEKGQEIGLEGEKEYKHFPAMALEVFQVGLESGTVDSMMGELANHYEMELEYKSRNLTALVEPILIVVIGTMILILALSIFLPMWNLIQVFR